MKILENLLWNFRGNRIEQVCTVSKRSCLGRMLIVRWSDVVRPLCKDFDLAKRALRALVTSRAESSRGPWNRFPTIEIGLPPLSRCSTERKPPRYSWGTSHGLSDAAASCTLFDHANHLFCSHFAQRSRRSIDKLHTPSRDFFAKHGFDFELVSQID